MKLRVPGMTGATGFAIATAIRGWMSTVRYEALYADPSLDPASGVGGPAIYVVWHEYMLPPLYLRANCRVTILISRHPDADLLVAIAKSSGFDCVRGSTQRGGVAALRELTRRGQQQHIVLTPDGPRGPRRRLAAGPVYLAAKLGRPIVPVGFGYHRARRLGSWDRFPIPRPFTTLKAMMGEAIHVPTGLDRAGIEAARLSVEAELNRLTVEAEAWAASGESRPGAVRLTRLTRAARSRLTAFPEPGPKLKAA